MEYSCFEKLLKLHNTSVYRVAKATGIPNSTFTDWKNGRSFPKADKLVRIADHFGLSLDQIFGRELENSFFDLQMENLQLKKELEKYRNNG